MPVETSAIFLVYEHEFLPSRDLYWGLDIYLKVRPKLSI
jgi:hypothetical protein